MWLANFEDGSSASSKSGYWTDIPKDKKVTGLQLQHPSIMFPVSLTGMENYFYMTEAVATVDEIMNGGKVRAIAEVIGGVKDGVIVEIRYDYPQHRIQSQAGMGFSFPGSLNTKVYKGFKYAEDILRKGI